VKRKGFSRVRIPVAFENRLALGLMGRASQHRYIGGKELLSVLRRGKEYRRAHGG